MKDKKILPVYICLIGLSVALIWVIQSRRAAEEPESTKVKQTVIPMSASDFEDDPRLKSAIQSQIQPQAETQNNSPTASSILQPNQPVN